ncbi:MAG: IPT/TIG domain-containing protein [Planctomycetes bacterium]|nr:IPT/TIG domain-containing protein [Planctomycetota bacterium]
MNTLRKLWVVAGVLVVGVVARAQWDPAAGQWGKTQAEDLRVMTWNVQDGICSSNNKVEGFNDWSGLARIVAAMKPDVLILQECGDNNGEGTGSGVDSVANLTTTVNLFLHGGNDPFHGNSAVTSWVQKYAATYDLPNVFVSGSNDGFNRNVILSRYPFADLNGDGRSQLSDIQSVSADLYAPGGTGGIRGFMFAEINLPDGLYAGNLVMGCAHLKSGSDASSMAQRITASENVAYYVDYMFNGAGGSTPDPRNKIGDIPTVTSVLDASTPVIMGGDWNEDENTNGRKGPAEWLTLGGAAGGTDGLDRNRTDATYDDARDVFNNGRSTEGSAKFDYLAWQDSIATLRRAWVFNSANVTPSTAMPPEIVGMAGGAGVASGIAADHRPVIADFILPLATQVPPMLTSVNPATGPVRGGNAVDLVGTDFSPAAAVTFGGVNAPVVSRTGSTGIRVTVPAGTAIGQVVDVSVNQLGGTSTLTNAYTYGENPIELAFSQAGRSVTFIVYGPPNRPVGLAVGPPGSMTRLGFTFCFGAVQTGWLPRTLRTNATGSVTASWTAPSAATWHAQGAVRLPDTTFVQTNCVTVITP